MEKLLVPKSYDLMVEKGKELVSKINGYQHKLAKYALEVCTIRHGGPSDKFYTITDYANDVGMNVKTLQRYIVSYRDILLRIGIDNPTQKQWDKAEKTQRIISSERAASNRSLGMTKKINTPYMKSLNKKKVQGIYDSIGEKPFVYEFEKQLRAVKHLKHVMLKRDLGIITDTRLVEMMEILDETSDHINNYLTRKGKR